MIQKKARLSIIMLVLPYILWGQLDSIQHDGYSRTYLVHLPTGYTGEEALPLVIAMHGGFGSAMNLQHQSGLSETADENNFIVVYPEGIRGGLINASSWNAGWCCGFASMTDVDDVGFIDRLLDTLQSELAIDPERVYATGMSNGGFMSYRLACELSHRIAAIAPVAASMSMDQCEPGRPVPVIHFHSYLDDNVPYLGGQGNGVSNHHNAPQDSVMEAWSSLNGCDVEMEIITENEQYKFTRWHQCSCNVEIHHYITRDGGHSWPGGQQTALGDPVSEYIDANNLMWAFFENYSLACQSTASEDPGLPKYAVYPNPAQDFLIIHTEAVTDADFIQIINTSGQIVGTQKFSGNIYTDRLPSGLYLLKILSSSGAYSFTFIKQ